MTVLEHPVRRPEWTCGACGQPWPCPPARVELGEQYAGRRVSLAVHMSAQLHQAVPSCRFLETFVARLAQTQAEFSVDGPVAEQSLKNLL